MNIAWTKKFIKYMVSFSLSEPLSSVITYYRQKDCAGKIYSAKRHTAVLHWLTNTIGGGLSLSNWPFMCVSKAYSSVHILTSKSNAYCAKGKGNNLEHWNAGLKALFWVGWLFCCCCCFRVCFSKIHLLMQLLCYKEQSLRETSFEQPIFVMIWQCLCS